MQQEFIPATGTLVVSRAGGLPYQKSTFEMLLRTLAFRNPSQNPMPGDRNLTFFATDSAGSGITSHLTIRFTDVNQAPTIIELDPSPIIILEGERHYISTNLFIADIDNSIMQGARVALTGAFETTDIIHCNRTHVEINCNYNAATGVMLLTGAANITTYEYVMQRLEFYTVGGAAHSGTRIATFQITDGLNYGEGRVRNLVVTAINNGPILNGIATDIGYNGLGPFFIQAGLILTDADDTSIESARVSLPYPLGSVTSQSHGPTHAKRSRAYGRRASKADVTTLSWVHQNAPLEGFLQLPGLRNRRSTAVHIRWAEPCLCGR